MSSPSSITAATRPASKPTWSTSCASLDGRDATEAKLSHITDLRARLATAGLTARDLAGPNATADRKLVAKARSKLAKPRSTDRPGLTGTAYPRKSLPELGR
ncbi:MAG TPA: hypothetical protein VFI47_10370 [Acidimicrobiales bacterium]|nr:hypothetical protein [Acidimicrobiales bacterium]